MRRVKKQSIIIVSEARKTTRWGLGMAFCTQKRME